MPRISVPGSIVLPLDTFEPKYKIQITDDNGTVHSICDTTSDSTLDYLQNANVIRSVLEKLSSFSLNIANPKGIWTDTFNGGELIEIYFDYTDASTLFFRGKIDNPKHNLNMSTGFTMNITGRDYPELADDNVTITFINNGIKTVFDNLFSTKYTDITFTFWENDAWTTTPTTITTEISAEYQNQKGVSVIKDLCDRFDVDAYLEYSGGWKLRVLKRNDKLNIKESIGYGSNLLGLTNFGSDTLGVKNKIQVYGRKESDNILLLATSEDTDSQSDLWTKTEIITDNSITNYSNCKSKADVVLAKRKIKYDTGSLNCIGLYSIKPGELINLSVPYLNINSNYRVYNYTTTFAQGVTTSMTITEKIPTIVDLFKRKDNTDELVTAYENLNDMDNSYVVWFDENPSVMTLSNCEEKEGKLQLESTAVNGTATLTNGVTFTSNILECEFRRFENYATDLDILEVSNNNGSTWETFNKETAYHIFSSTGSVLKFRINLNRDSTDDPTPAYESVAVLVKLE